MTIIPNSYQTPNWLVDQLMRWLEPNEWVALSFMDRHILGWQDSISNRRNRISLSQFENGLTPSMGGCGLTRPQLTKALAGLVKYRIVAKVGGATKDGQQWELSEQPSIDWEGLKVRKESKAARGQRRVKKAAEKSGEKRRAGTLDVLVDRYGGRTSPGTLDVPADRYAGRTSTGTLDVHTKAIVVVVDKESVSLIDDQQQQATPPRTPQPEELKLFAQHGIAHAVWSAWMNQPAETVIAAIFHAAESEKVKNPVGLMRAMLEQGKSKPSKKAREKAQQVLTGVKANEGRKYISGEFADFIDR